MSPLFLLRWSLRDLRRAWVQVAAVALVIAIGTGLFAALEGSSTWRRVSNDASFAATGMYDLRVRSTEGLDTAQGSMLAVLDSLDDPTVVARAEERLLVDTQVDASTADRTILVPGRIVGLDTSSGGPWLTSVVVPSGGGRVVGATFVGPEAGEQVHAATVAITGRVPVWVLRHAVPSYPTASELWLRLLEALPTELRTP